jgi:O-antigen/teichoic acid export membrane protein
MGMSALFLKVRHLASGSSMRRNIGMTLGRQIAAALMQLLVVVIIARQLGPEGNGFYAMAVLVPTLLANFLNLGIGPATVYHLSRRDFSANQAVRGNIRLALVITFVGLVVSLPVLTAWGDTLFPGIPKELLFIGLACFPIMLLLAFLATVLQGMEDFRAFNASVLLPPLITLTGVTVALYIFDAGIYGALTAFILGQLAALIAVSLFLRTHVPVDEAKVAGKRADKANSYNQRVLDYGWKSHLSNVITFVNYRADIFLVNFFLTPAATGLYVIAVQISEKLWMPSQAVSTVLFPRLSAMKDKPLERLKLTRKGFVLVALITALISGIAALALYWLIGPIFGDDYREALPAFLWLIPGVALWAGARVQANCIAAAGKPEWNMYVSLGVLTINVAGNIILIPEFGIVGAAWATSSAYVFDAIVKYFLVKRTVQL